MERKIHLIPINKIYPLISSNDVKDFAQVKLDQQLKIVRNLLRNNTQLTVPIIESAFLIEAMYDPNKDLFQIFSHQAHVRTWLAYHIGRKELPTFVTSFGHITPAIEQFWHSNVDD